MDSSLNSLLTKFSKSFLVSKHMKLAKDLNKILTSGSLIIQALGFAALGFLSFTHNYHAAEIANNSSDHVLSLIGSLSSVLVGAIFLVAVCLYWSRYARIFRSPDSNELRR
jgi:choline-glycine betaine transporter